MNASPSHPIVRLKRGKEKHLLQGHPLIFSGAVEEWGSSLTAGTVVEVCSNSGDWLARGLANPDAQVAVRVYTRRKDEQLDDSFFARRIEQAVAFRQNIVAKAGWMDQTNACRLVFSESDGLSGLVADRYADVLSAQIGARALVPFLPALLNALRRIEGINRVSIRVEEETAERERMSPAEVDALSDPNPAPVVVSENGLRFEVDFRSGQKTGFFLDQRNNRRRVAAYAQGRRMLSAYCYTGAFEVYAAHAGAAHITGLDRSESALARAAVNHRLNGTDTPVDYIRGDVPEILRRFRDAGRSFDLIVLDPPRFVSNRAQKEKGMRAYKDINLLALKLLTPGGILATFSCSGQISLDDFKTMLGWAAKDAGRNVRHLETLSQPPDHPILAAFPESEYLKGLICWAE